MRKRMAAILAAAMLAMGTFAGCGSVADADTVEIVNVSYDPTRELYQAYNTLFEKHWEEQTGQKVRIIQSHGGSGKQGVEVAAMPGGSQGEAPGNPPSDNNGGAPAGNGNSDNNDSTEAPGKPDSDGADSTETPGNPPSGDNNSAPSDNGGAPDMSNMTTETINLTDSTIYYDKNGKETTLSALSEGTMVTITLDDDSNAATVTISDNAGGQPGGNTPGGGAPGGSTSSQPESYNAVTEYTEDTEVSDETFSSTGSDENAVLVSNGANVTLKDITLDRTSSDSTDGDSSSFYGDHLAQHQPA